MRTIFSVMLIYSFVATLYAKDGAPPVPKFAVDGARWYYKNVGKNNDVVKHIYVAKMGDSTVEAFNFRTEKFENFTASTIVFHYLNIDSQTVEYDTLLVRSDTFGVYFYDFKIRIFDFLYTNLRNGKDFNIQSINPFAKGNSEYQNVQSLYQTLIKGTCATINDKTLGYYQLGGNMHCHSYPLGNEIIERIGSTYYMLRFDSCRTNLYGGPLLWYYDPEIGFYEHGKTKVELCKDDTVTNSIIPKSKISGENVMKLYPVPFTNILHLETTGTETGLVHIYDMDGKCLFTVNLHTNEKLTLNTSTWPAGVYIARQQTKNGIVTSKVIKQ